MRRSTAKKKRKQANRLPTKKDTTSFLYGPLKAAMSWAGQI
jgi:hypothetical protein